MDTDLESVAYGGRVAKADGSDILFTAADGVTKLNHEIENYDPATGRVIAWVQVTSLSVSTDTSVYVYYGNASAVDQQSTAGAWDSGYDAVWHLSHNGVLSMLDSTSNSRSATDYGSYLAPGNIDGAAIFWNNGWYIESSNFDDAPVGLTASAWFNTNGGSGHQTIVSKFGAGGWASGAGWGLFTGGMLAPNQIYAMLQDQGGNNWSLEYSDVAIDDQQWHYAVMTIAANTVALYVDGNRALNDSNYGIPVNTGNSSNVRIGTDYDSDFFSGSIDEVRISHNARSSDWIKTEYNNQNAPGSFLSEGPAQTNDPVAAPTFTPAAGTYNLPQAVSINTATSGASVRYTTDGSAPSETVGALYSAPVTVSVTSTINAIAYESGMPSSAIASATYTIVALPPAISSISPSPAAAGTQVTISGTGFGSLQVREACGSARTALLQSVGATRKS